MDERLWFAAAGAEAGLALAGACPMQKPILMPLVLIAALLAVPGGVSVPPAAAADHSRDGGVAATPKPSFDDWSQAGYPGEIPYVTDTVINVRDAGAVGDGVTDDYAAIQAAIDGVPDPAVIYLPSGTYRIESDLDLKSGVVLRGEGYRLTHIECMNAGGCIQIQGARTGGFVDVQSGLAKGSSQIVVSSSASFTVGQGGEIQQDDIVPASASWGEDAVGQMVKIVAINGNTLTIDPPLHVTYTPDKNPIIRPIRYVERIGIEDLHLKRLSSGSSSDGSNVNITRAADCWIRRVESEWTERYHFAVSESLHLEIRDSYIHDTESKGDGGEGYGASLGRHVTSVLVENNIFNELRHAMIVQLGTNGCVFGYNYAQRNYSDDGWDKSVISLHGHYPFLNLFEGNIVGWAYMGDYWGDIGPDNTLFRNSVWGTDRHQEFGSYRGIWLRYFHGPQYVVGNEILGDDGVYFYSDATGDPNDVVVHGNSEKGTVTWDPAYSQTLETSYYLASKPVFYGEMAWPSIGGDTDGGTNPAYERWLSGNYVPSAAELALSLYGAAADQAIYLEWTVDATLPSTATWRIEYYSQTVASTVVATDSLTHTARSHTLVGLENLTPYTVTLSSIGATPPLSDTVCVMPTDVLLYVPLVTKED
jgi:hypothetical protein